MARRSRNKRRREAKRRRAEKPVVDRPALHAEINEGINRHVAEKMHDQIVDALSDDALDPRDTLTDTEGDKIGRAQTPSAERLRSSDLGDRVEYKVRIKKRFAAWLEDYAARRNLDPEVVIDFAIRQIWLHDEDRMQGDTMTQQRWREIAPPME